MTKLLRLHIKAVRTIKKNPYRQKNSVHEQVIKKLNRKRQNTLPKNNNIISS